MRHSCLITILLLLIPAIFAFPPAAEATGKKAIILLVQQDTRREAAERGLAAGLNHLMAGLPAQTPIRLYLFSRDEFHIFYQGPAAGYANRESQLHFGLENQGTDPYRILARFIRNEKINNQTIFWITSGESIFHLRFTEDPKMTRLVDMAQRQHVTVTAIHLPRHSDYYFNAEGGYSPLLHLVQQTNGKIYRNYISFTALFQAMLQDREIHP